MCNGVVTGNSNAGMEYQEPNPVTPEGDPQDVNVVILFTPYSYDLLKDYSSWKWMNQYAEVYSHYEYGRFISLLEWDNEKKYAQATIPTEFKDVPASDKASDRADYLKQNPLDMSLIVDCSSEKCYVIDSELSLKQANNVTKEVKEWDDLADYLAFAISEIKDHLFRLHKQKKYGYVNFTIAAYQPLTPMMFALLDLAGVPMKESKEHMSFITYLRQKAWFANFKPWLDKYSWRPKMKSCSLYQGYFYGVSEETLSNRYSRIAEKFQSALQVIYHYDQRFHGKLSHGKVDWNQEECKQWKDAGGFTIAETDESEWPRNARRFGKGEDNMKSVMGVSYWSQEEPVVQLYENYWTESQLKRLRDFYLRQVKGGGSPVWNLTYNKRTGQGEVKVRKDEVQKNVTSKDLKAELDEWKKSTYDPQMAENKAMLDKYDKRKTDATENEVWKRKSVEDEQASDQWSADIDTMEYHGKMVKKDKFSSNVARLDKELKDRQDAIEHAEKLETMEKWLTVLTVLQIIVGLATLGVGSMAVGVALAVVDIGIEVGKAAVQFHYDKNYTMGKALKEHTLGIVMDLASCVLFVPALFRIHKVKNAQKSAQQAIEAHEAQQAIKAAESPKAVESPKIVEAKPSTAYSYTNYSQTTGSPMKPTSVSSGMPTEVHTINTEQLPIRPAGKNYEVIGMSTTQNGAKSIPDDGMLHVGSGLSNDKPTWVRIKRDNGSLDTLRIDNKKQKEWLKNHTGKDANEWNGFRKSQPKEPPKNVVKDNDPVTNLKNEAQASFSYSGPNDTITFDQLAKNGYNPQTGPSVGPVMDIKYDEFTIPSFGELLRYHGSGHQMVKAEKIVQPKAYHLLKEAQEEERFLINEVEGSITNNVTLFYVGYSTTMNILQVVNSGGIPLAWAKENIAAVIDGKKAEDIFDEPKKETP